MKVAIEILSTNTEPSITNIQGMKDSFVFLSNEMSFNNSYDFYFYYGGYSASTLGGPVKIEKDKNYKNMYTVKVSTKETIYDTFEKGVWALKYIEGYDWYIRINISCYLNLFLLDKVISQFNEDIVYCNAINSYINDEKYFNDIYPRGDMMIFSEKTRQGILSVSDKYFRCDRADENRLNIPHVDDCLFGLCLIDYFGNSYYNHLQMLQYGYYPEASEKIKSVSLNSIGNRVKTNPPGINYSGYSWADNEYRRFDSKKMLYLNQVLIDTNNSTDYYKDIKLESLFSNARPTLFVSLSNQRIETFFKYLDKKRGS